MPDLEEESVRMLRVNRLQPDGDRARAGANTLGILVVDDQRLMRDMVSEALEQHFPEARVDTARDLETALEFLSRRTETGLILLDYRMPDMRGLRSVKSILRAAPRSKVVIVSAFISARDLDDFRQAGVAAAVTKDLTMRQLIAVVEKVLEGETMFEAPSDDDKFHGFAQRYGLTAREQEAFRCMVSGMRNARIAAEMGVSEATAKVHLHNAFKKMNVNTRVEAYEIWNKNHGSGM